MVSAQTLCGLACPIMNVPRSNHTSTNPIHRKTQHVARYSTLVQSLRPQQALAFFALFERVCLGLCKKESKTDKTGASSQSTKTGGYSGSSEGCTKETQLHWSHSGTLIFSLWVLFPSGLQPDKTETHPHPKAIDVWSMILQIHIGLTLVPGRTCLNRALSNAETGQLTPQ